MCTYPKQRHAQSYRCIAPYWGYSDWRGIDSTDNVITKLFECQSVSAMMRYQLCAFLVEHASAFLLPPFGEEPESTCDMANALVMLRNMQRPLFLIAHFDSCNLDGFFVAQFRQLKSSQCFSFQDSKKINEITLTFSFNPFFPFHQLTCWPNFLVKIHRVSSN